MTPGEELPQVILDTKARHTITWKSAILLYDNTFDRDMISRCVIALSRNFPDDSNEVQPLSVSIYRIRETTLDWNRRKFIRNLLKSLPTKFIGTNFLILVTTDLMQTIMEIARDLKMVDTFSQWFYIVSDTNYLHNNITSITSLIDEGNNIAFIYNFTRFDDDCVFGVKCHCNEVLRAFVLGLSKAIREEMAIYGQISDEEWEIIRPSKRERRDNILNSMIENLKKTSKCSNCTMWKVETADVWGTRYKSTVFSGQTALERKNVQDSVFDFKLIHTGMWRPFEGLTMVDALFPHISHGFRRRIFHIVTYHTTKGIRLLTSDIPTEVVNLLNDNRIIFGAVASTVNERYKKLINFSIPISIQPYSFIVAKPKEISRIYLFTAPYTHGTWLCLAAMIAILPPILCVVNRLSPFYEFHNKCTKKGLFKFSNCFWYIYGALLQQGGLYLPQADSGRLIIVLVTTYCGNLVAFLTFPRVDINVKTVGQLVSQNSLSWGMRSGTYLEEYIRDSQDLPKYTRLYKGGKFYLDEDENIIDDVRKGHHAYIDWRSNLQYIMRREYLATGTCDFALSTDEFMDEQIAIVLPYNSPYLELFNQELTRLHQMGLIQRWIKEYLPRKDRCTKQSSIIEVLNHIVTTDDMQGSFLVLILGFLAGFFFFFIECICKWWQRRKNRDIIQPFVE
ncbi:hypothetical protein ACKWTF_016567 [Chironomus riparius]